jgi:hypothetical protein
LIMADRPKEFGKRRAVATPQAPPVKRSGHVALLLMGTFAIGGGAYALMPRGNCGPGQPGMAADVQPKADCSWHGIGGHGWSGGWSSRSNFFGGDSSSSGSHSGASSDSASGGVTRGGFGSFAHAFGFSGG